MTRTTMTTTRSHALARPAPLAAIMPWVQVTWPRLVIWWNAQTSRTKLALAVAALFAAASLLNLASAGLGRAFAGHPSASTLALTMESAPTDATKAWAVTKVWQGSGTRETESFTVGAHWRVDWLYSPAKAGDALQIFVYAADGRLLMNVAADTEKGGADTSFWGGAGTYFLKINSSGGDWKLDIQDLH